MPPDIDTLALSNVQKVLEEFSAINDALPVSHMLAFILIVLWPGRSVGEYARLLDCAPGPASRRISNLGNLTRDLQPGLGLVEGRCNDPRDRRLQIITPTAKGLALAEKITAAMERRRIT